MHANPASQGIHLEQLAGDLNLDMTLQARDMQQIHPRVLLMAGLAVISCNDFTRKT
jgi:hypothetical protein